MLCLQLREADPRGDGQCATLSWPLPYAMHAADLSPSEVKQQAAALAVLTAKGLQWQTRQLLRLQRACEAVTCLPSSLPRRVRRDPLGRPLAINKIRPLLEGRVTPARWAAAVCDQPAPADGAGGEGPPAGEAGGDRGAGRDVGGDGVDVDMRAGEGEAASDVGDGWVDTAPCDISDDDEPEGSEGDAEWDGDSDDEWGDASLGTGLDAWAPSAALHVQSCSSSGTPASAPSNSGNEAGCVHGVPQAAVPAVGSD